MATLHYEAKAEVLPDRGIKSQGRHIYRSRQPHLRDSLSLDFVFPIRPNVFPWILSTRIPRNAS